jgi:multiple sugar transport system permease protein
MSDSAVTSLANRVARSTPGGLAHRLLNLSDRGIAWLFIAPTIALLLAINIFPLIWTIYLSFTNYRSNRPGAEIEWVGTRNYERVLGSEDIWGYLQVTARFVCWTMLLQVALGLGLALLINRNFRTAGFWTTLILIPMMLSPAVVGTFWTYLYQPQTGIFSYIVNLFANVGALDMIGSVHLAPWAIVIVDTWMWTPYIMLLCLAGLRSIPAYLYEAAEIDRANTLQKFWYITLPRVLPFLMLAVLFRGIENFKMFDMVVELTSGGPGSTTELASINLKREAFENRATGIRRPCGDPVRDRVRSRQYLRVALNKVKQ